MANTAHSFQTTQEVPRRAPTAVPAQRAVGPWGDLAAGVLDLIPHSVIVVEGDGRVRGMNEAARALIDKGCGLSLGAEGICNGSPSVNRELKRRVRSAVAGVPDAHPLHLQRIGGAPMSARVVPFEVDGVTRAAVFVSEARPAEPPSTEEIMDRFGVTPMESRVAYRLAAGLAVEEIAKDLGIAVQTVRGHLKQVFAKTGTHRQAELVALILSGPSSLPS